MNRRRLAAVLLVIAAIGFVAGSSTESGTHDESTGRIEVEQREAGEHDDAAEREAEESVGHDEASEADETILGLDRDSPVLIGLGALLSLALAALVWFRPRRETWLAVAVLAVVFALFDVLELIHQLDESSGSRAAVAVAVGMAHVGAATIAGAAVHGANTRRDG